MRGGRGQGSGSASRPAAFLALVRPLNGVIAAAAVLVGAFVSRRPVALGPSLLGAAATFAAVSAANALNDVVDREIDRINRPLRPVAAGLIASRAASLLAGVAWTASLVLAAKISAAAVVLVVVWVGLTACYCASLKRVPIVGNVIVSLVVASAFLMGGVSQRAVVPSLVPFSLAFLVNLAREIVKDAEDVEGDAAAGVATVAVVFGTHVSVVLARVVTLALMAAALVPIGIYGRDYAVAIVPVEGILAWTLFATARRTDRGGLRLYSNSLKAAMVLGLVAIAAGVL
jgi:geranylgeranylglycerol-phosphate geranylgeranyltransferase